MLQESTIYGPINGLKLNQALMSDLFSDITVLRLLFQLPVQHTDWDKDAIKFHDDLYEEEFNELLTAETRKDKLDALIDQVVVQMQRLTHIGISDLERLRQWDYHLLRQLSLLVASSNVLEFDFCQAWNIVHASNLSKLCTPANVNETLAKYEALGVPVEAVPADLSLSSKVFGDAEPRFVIKVSRDCVAEDKFYPKGKFLKSIDYTPADLSRL